MARHTQPRPWISDRHLYFTAHGEAGSIMVRPLRKGEIYFDAAMSNHVPANKPEGDYDSTVIDIGGGVEIRASGNVVLRDGAWEIYDPGRLNAKQYPSGRELTARQKLRACGVILAIIAEWARTHEGDLAQADDIDRNNAAHTLEEKILHHETALDILRSHLKACEEGEEFSQYPNLPTDRR